MATVRTKSVTEDELLRLNAVRPVEVVNGEIVPVMSAASITHIYVVRNAFRILDGFVTNHKLGEVFPDGIHYVLKKDAQGLKDSRLPDVSFLRKGRMTEAINRDKPFRGAPDLAIEVVSPSEGEETTLAKVRDYLEAGTEQVWVLYPHEEEVHVYSQHQPKSIRVYSGEDILEAESLFPGLKLPVKDFFVIAIE